MASTFTSNLGITLPANGDLDGVWGDTVNTNMDIIDRAVNGVLSLSLSGTASTLTTTDGALSDGQYKLLVLAGSPTGTHTITISPNDADKIYFVRNTTAQSVVFTQGTGGNVTIATGDSGIIYANGGGAAAAVANITDHFAMNSVAITGGTITGITDLAIADGGTGASDAGTARTNLGLGTIATQSAASVAITGGSITGITDLAVADGGTGASDAATARTNLGLAIGTNVQAYDAELTAIAALAVTDGNFIVGNGTTWVAESGATARTSLGLGTLATQNGTFSDAVLGPASATDNAVARFSSTTGKLVQNSAVTIADTGVTTIVATDAGTNTVLDAMQVQRQSSGTPAVGIGVGLEFAVGTAAGNTEIGAIIQAVTTDVTAASEDFDLVFKTMAAGAAATEGMRVKSNNIVDVKSLAINGTTVTSTAAELNTLDGSVAGTIVNNKAVVYGAAGQVNATTLQIAGTSITATAAELNKLDGVTATTSELNFVDGVTSGIQGQLDLKAPLASPTFTGQAKFPNGTAAAPAVANNAGDSGVLFGTAFVAFSTSGTERARFNSSGALSVASSFGTAGQALKSGGSAAAPTWGNVIDYQVFTASGTWTKPSGLSADAVVIVHMWAGGGSGGRGGSNSSTAGGGGGGGFMRIEKLASSLGATAAVVVGAGGVGVSVAGSGNAGGVSSFDGITVYGGLGGGGNNSSGSRDGASGGGWSASRVGGGSKNEGASSENYPDAFGGGCGNYSATTAVGALWGGGGGVASSGSGVVTSIFGGSGGATDSAAGTAPGGGGGGRGATSGTSGAGARGEVRVWTIG